MVDSNIYVKNELLHQKFVILILYVDNSIIIGNDMEFLHAIKECLTTSFEITYEGFIKDFDECLRMVVQRNMDIKSINISQNKHLMRILSKINMNI
jgi:hypothetical protein